MIISGGMNIASNIAVAQRHPNVPPGGRVWPKRSSPQQATMPSLRTPHVEAPPAETCRKVPPGGEAWPPRSSPEQATGSSLRTPQEWIWPAETGKSSVALQEGQLIRAAN